EDEEDEDEEDAPSSEDSGASKKIRAAVLGFFLVSVVTLMVFLIARSKKTPEVAQAGPAAPKRGENLAGKEGDQREKPQPEAKPVDPQADTEPETEPRAPAEPPGSKPPAVQPKEEPETKDPMLPRIDPPKVPETGPVTEARRFDWPFD